MTLQDVLGSHYYDTLFTGVSVASDQSVYVSAVLQKLDQQNVEHTVMLRYLNGEWGQYMIPFSITSHTILGENGKRQIMAMAPNGNVHIAGPEGFSEEQIDTEKNGPNDLRAMTEISVLNGHLHACGMARIAYRRERESFWRRIDEGARNNPEVNPIGGFKSMTIDQSGSYCAVGFEGEIWWKTTGSIWEREDSPTNVKLEKVVSIRSKIYICGAKGIVIFGHKGSWKKIQHEATNETLWGIGSIKNKVYTASSNAIYEISEDTLSPVDLGSITSGYISSNNTSLWSAGARDLYMTTDGLDWVNMASLRH